jgi:hypothetical protein
VKAAAAAGAGGEGQAEGEAVAGGVESKTGLTWAQPQEPWGMAPGLGGTGVVAAGAAGGVEAEGKG